MIQVLQSIVGPSVMHDGGWVACAHLECVAFRIGDNAFEIDRVWTNVIDQLAHQNASRKHTNQFVAIGIHWP
jgi:hypothetical protein